MRAKSLFFCLKAFVKVRCLGLKSPLLIGWDLTYKCNLSCKYCGINDGFYPELSTDEVLSLIDELSELGVQRIHFGGGEPLLREDIGEIITACKEKNIFVAVVTNGILFREKFAKLKGVDLVKVSLDGPEAIHDSIRQRKGSFAKVIDTIKLAKQHNLKVAINTTLSAYNLNCIDFILETSSLLEVPVKFQPVNTFLAMGKNIEGLLCPSLEYDNAIRKLIAIKRDGKKNNIINSTSGLQYLLSDPRALKLKCCAGLIYFRINPQGKLYRCSSSMGEIYNPRIKQLSLPEAMSEISSKICRKCLCTATLELNLMYSLKLDAIRNLMQHI